MQRQITGFKVSRIWSIHWFPFQWPWVTLGLFKQSRSRVTIYALDVLCAQLTRDLFATAKLLLKVLLQKGTWSFPGQSLTDDSRTRRFPDIRFADKTFPGQYVFQAPFLPRDALHKRGLCRRVVSVRPSVRLFVQCQHLQNPKTPRPLGWRRWNLACTLCPKKVVHQTHGDSFVNSWRIFKNFLLLENQVNFQRNTCDISYYTFSMLPHYLAKFRRMKCWKFTSFQQRKNF